MTAVGKEQVTTPAEVTVILTLPRFGARREPWRRTYLGTETGTSPGKIACARRQRHKIVSDL